uniref:winged helix-turn-helix transcriptional regulator n=1 Tax=Nonomuraea bangladeshensis TaxID=404385 RepID=UPI003F49965C
MVSDFQRPGDVFLADCPARLAVEIIADKWAVVVIYALSRGPRRHGEILALVGGISKKVLTQTLRRLQRYGLVSRQVFGTTPARTQYELTELGTTLVVPIAALTQWAETHGSAVMEALDAAENEQWLQPASSGGHGPHMRQVPHVRSA